ncbi:unnamed protein product [Cylicostephanus goldi]|uniref:Major facilitator superfamily associated domain-containing protein n=1 Tax=Cylicostephanus goldi TaxID=71465 RepID=A0A3P6PWV4_CYLGO|nr:unnamed protein product [Cylicostephanus goldi]
MNRAWWNEMICIICLSIATTSLMTSYDTQSFIVESILHSVHMREPTRIDVHAGYYGPAVLYAAYTTANLFAPWICYRIGSKWTLFVGSLMFPAYQAGFFFLHSLYYYATQALMGIGFASEYSLLLNIQNTSDKELAVYYAGQGLYMSEHSTKSTISRNSALVSAIGNCRLVAFYLLYLVS